MQPLAIYRYFLAATLMLSGLNGAAQYHYADSLQGALRNEKNSRGKLATIELLTIYYINIYPDSAILSAGSMIDLAKETGNTGAEALGYYYLGFAFDHTANYTSALKAGYKCVEIAETMPGNNSLIVAKGFELLGHLHGITGNNLLALEYYDKGIALLETQKDSLKDAYNLFNRKASRILTEKPDSAIFLAQIGFQIALNQSPNRRSGFPYLNMWTVYKETGRVDSALQILREGIEFSKTYKLVFYQVVLQNAYADYMLANGNKDSAAWYAYYSLALSRRFKFKLFEIRADEILFRLYEKNNSDSALKYITAMASVKDEVFNQVNGQQFQLITSDELLRKRDLEEQRKKIWARISLIGLLIVLLFFLFIVFILYRHNKQKQKAYDSLQQQKQETDIQKDKTVAALKALQNAQSELIQAEKMASLGELTAGIAHEIQNPLNFVNNFSEVNKELLAELSVAIENGKPEIVREIICDLTANEDKIMHHGGRADAIVKGMLLHSRSSSGNKELTDLNALTEEYLKLSYHGFRAKDNHFNTSLERHFDPEIGMVLVIPQEIGRVLLNLFNNAFYAVYARLLLNEPNYKPTISVGTNKLAGKIELHIQDNGVGFSKNLAEKIFQPFFTTKPTGEGTGLGLSISYDIITKVHGGELKASSVVGEGSKFTITLYH